MGYFTARERSSLGKSVDERAPTKPREAARNDFAPQRRPIKTDIVSLVQQVSEDSVGNIDAVIAELQHRREAILGESKRMQREIVAYAELSRSTMDSTRIISESLTNLVTNLIKQPDTPTMSELAEAVSDPETKQFAESESNGRFELADTSHLPGTRAGRPILQTREAPNE
jgi:hypothetical protein